MNEPAFRIDFASWDEHLAELRAVREPVFLVEQAVSPELEWDELDASSVHVLARDQSGQPIGTARLTPDGHIGRMAVLRPWRGRGVGRALLERLIERAGSDGHPALELHAQTHAIGFYERFGFAAFGPEYEEAGMPHRSMRLVLEPAPDPRRLIEVDSSAALIEASLGIITGARRGLSIYTRDLDPLVLNNRPALDALRGFAIGGRDTLARVLVHDLRNAVQDGHGLIALAQRLPSRFEIRVIEQDPDVQYAAAFLLNDRGGYVFRPLATRPEASACRQGPARQRQLLSYFNEVWERARPATELRALG